MPCLTSESWDVFDDHHTNLVEQLHGLGAEAGMKDFGLHISSRP